ncbi:Arylacetamide deacetylase [Parasponia andersonii]|uniref:Arylacetamide deacetylase n=1 Tax=Parasponia andersonii TaxID=3476 RepID=A0A2P5D748_PARAD|nr:Arylacetamide deacetylase [Parasponia andersonii]
MATTSSDEVAHDFFPFLKIYKDGRIERVVGVDVLPASLDPTTGIESKDVVISPETGVAARVYVPKSSVGACQPQKLPLVVYFHGGGFCVETPFCAKYHHAVNSLVAEANVVAVSVHYRLAPENPIPVAYDDSWAAVKWVVSHSGGIGPDEWLNSSADFKRVFFAGDSAGANIAHQLALRAGLEGGLGSGDSSKLVGIALVHPYFWGVELIEDEVNHPEKAVWAEGIWRFATKGTSGSDDPLINPAKDPNLGKLGAERVLVCVAEEDILKDRGWYYKEVLEKSGWRGTAEVVEATGDGHVFHLANPTCDNALAMLKKISAFINQDWASATNIKPS